MIDERVRRSRSWSLAIPAAALVFASGHVSAQEPPGAAAQAPLETIIVTGSRIVIPGVAVSNPVTSIDAQAIKDSGVTDFADYLKSTPAIIASTDKTDAAGSNTFIGGTGLTLLNLRNLGEDRTLVLVERPTSRRGTAGIGRRRHRHDPVRADRAHRHPDGWRLRALRCGWRLGRRELHPQRDFEGYDVRAQYGSSSEGDADTVLVSVVLGENVDEAAATSRSRSSTARRRCAPTSATTRVAAAYTFRENPDDVATTIRTCPTRCRLVSAFLGQRPRGGGRLNFDFFQDFNGDDQPWDFGDLPFSVRRADSAVLPAGRRRPAARPVHRRPDARGGALHVQRATDLRDHGRRDCSPISSTRGPRRSARRSRPSISYCSWSPTTPTRRRTSPPRRPPKATALLVSRDNFDMGIRGEDIERDTRRVVAGIEGDLDATTRYEVSLVYGSTEVDNLQTNNRFNDRFAAALDAVVDPDTGEIVCRSNLDASAVPFNLAWNGWDGFEPLPGTWAGSFTPGPDSGCVPVNILGTNAVSPEARDWIMTDSLAFSKIEQFVATAYLTGDSSKLFELPAGPVGWAAGVEYREEKSKSTPAPEDQAGLTLATSCCRRAAGTTCPRCSPRSTCRCSPSGRCGQAERGRRGALLRLQHHGGCYE